jgi:hypothetical protein
LRVLLAAKHPHGSSLAVGGVQSWTLTVAQELRRLGHEAFFWGPEWPLPQAEFDLGVFANLPHTWLAEKLCGRVVKVSHGIVPDEKGDPGYLATSEEVQAKWGCAGVIRQPLDLDFWSPGSAPRTLLTRHSYRQGLTFLPGLAGPLGLGFAHLRQASPEVVRDTLRRSVVVVATGRAAVEAMACGAAVVIADDRKYQGALFDPDPVGAMTRNYSGRGGRPATRSELQLGICRAIQRGSLRAHAERHHDVRDIVRELLC